MNSLEVKEYLLNNTDKLVQVLKSLGLHKIDIKTEHITCARDNEGNGTSTYIKLNKNLTTQDFKRGIKGDIFTLIQDIKNVSFPNAVKYINKLLGFSTEFKIQDKPKIFGGFFDTIKKQSKGLISLSKIYPIDLLDSYENIPNEMFLYDGISIETQRLFNIGYDWNTHRITIPEFDCEGNLIGIMGRWNGDNYDELGLTKYYPIIEFPKSQSLYGYHINYRNLVNNNIFLWESQKGVMKLHSQGVYNSLGLGWKFISPIQINYIQALNPKSIIVGFDEGVPKEDFIKECEKLKSKSSFIKYKIGYLYDEKHEFLKEGSKDSPSDLPIEELRKMTKKLVRWINE